MRRREFLTGSGILLAGLLATPAEAVLPLTPNQTEGPFYPVGKPAESDADLTRIARGGKAKGQEIVVSGVVRDIDGKPLAQTQVEIWHACASGRYGHPSDPNPAPFDPAFQGYGRVTTDASGSYRFRTIKPGAYPAARGWDRPPHIHFKVRCPGHAELVTQMYFEGDALNAKDYILLDLTPAQRKLVVVNFAPVSKVPTGAFDIVLGRAGSYSGITTPYLD